MRSTGNRWASIGISLVLVFGLLGTPPSPLANTAADAQVPPPTEVFPISYAMPGGDGELSTGSYDYWDASYPQTSESEPLSGQLGELTDGFIASANWNAGPGGDASIPYVGWVNKNPTITFTFDGSVKLGLVRLHVDDSNGAGGVLPPVSVDVAMGGVTQSFPVTDPVSGAPFAIDLAVGDLAAAGTVEITLFNHVTEGSDWVFLSEVEFFGEVPTLTIAGYDPSKTGGEWGWHEVELQDARGFVTNPSNFGSGGVVPVEFVTGAPIVSPDAASLAGVDVFFTGYVPTNTYTDAEKIAIRSFVEEGGALIATSDSQFFSMVDIFDGMTTTSQGSGNNVITNPTHPIADGPFGNVTAYQQFATVGYHENLPSYVTVIGTDSASPFGVTLAVIEPGALASGSGPVVFAADVDIFSNAYGGVSGSAANPELIKNIFAWVATAESSDVNNFSYDVTPGSAPVGVAEVPILDIPIEAIVGGSGAEYESAPLGSIPLGSIPLGSIDLNASPLGSIPLGSIPLGSISLAGTPLGSIPLGSIPLGSIGGWEALLAGTALAGVPLQSVTLREVLSLSPAPSGLADVALSDIALEGSPLGSISLPGIALGDADLLSIDSTLCDGLPTTFNCGDSSTNSLLELEIASAPLGSIPLGSIPLGSIPLGSIPLGSIPLGSIPLGSIPLGSIPLGSIPLGSIDLLGVPLGSIPLGSIPLGSIPLGSIDLLGAPLGSIPLGSIPLGSIGTSGACSELAGDLLYACNLLGVTDASTLTEFINSLPTDSTISDTPLGSIPLGSIDLDTVPLGSIPLGSIPLGSIPLGSIDLAGTPLGSIPLGFIGAGGACALLESPLSCGDLSVDDGDSLLDLVLALEGASSTIGDTPLGSIPLDSIPLGSIPLGSIDLAAVEINGSQLGSIPLGSIGLGDTGLAGSPLGSIPLGSIPLGSIGNVVTCGLVVDCGSATLGEAELAGAILPGATLGDLEGLFGTMTLGELDDLLTMELLYGEGTLGTVGNDYGDLTLGQILMSVLLESDFPWETLDLQSLPLQEIAPTGTVSYSASFDLTGSGTALEGSLIAAMPADFLYVEGSANISIPSQEIGPTLIADPIVGEDESGEVTATFDLVLDAGDSYVVAWDAVPGFETGVFTSSASVNFPTDIPAPTGPTSDLAEITVTEFFTGNDQFIEPALIEADTLVFSHISTPNVSDFFSFTAGPVGTRHAVFVSQFDQDTDLVLYKPATAPVSAVEPRNVPLGSIPIEDDGLNYGTNFTEEPELESDIDIQSAPLGSISINRGTTPESAETTISAASLTPGEPFTIQVSGYQGNTSTSPYVVRVKKEQAGPVPICSPYGFSSVAGGPTLGALPNGLNTLFLLNWGRLAGAYGTTEADNILAAVDSLIASQANGVIGAVVPVDGVAAYSAWDANPCDPNAANAVVSAITGLISQIQADHPSLAYVTVIGGDDVIPFARLDDLTAIANESTYTEGFDDSALYGSQVTRHFLSDDPYGDLDPIPWLDRNLHVPELAVGRLVEAPADIVAALEKFVTYQGLLDPQTAAVAGYDFLDDGSTVVRDRLANIYGGTNIDSLIDLTFSPGDATGGAWTKADLLALLDLSDGTPGVDTPDIFSVNAHSDHYRQLPSFGDANNNENTLFEVGDLSPLLVAALDQTIIFTMGCHAGLSVSDIGVSTNNADWAQNYAGLGGQYFANSGYGYGDTAGVALTERLMAEFAENLDGTMAIGQAMTFAKQEYFAQLGQYGVYDEKAMQQVIFYGLPMYSVGATAPASPPAPLPTAADAGTGLQAASLTLSPTFTETLTAEGTIWSVDGQTQQTHYRPTQPRDVLNVTAADPALLAHGAIVLEATTTDETNVDPVYFRPNITGAVQTEPEVPSDEIATPIFGLNVSTFNGPGAGTFGEPFAQRQKLSTILGSFRSAADGSQLGTQRLVDDAEVKVFYAPVASDDFKAPRILSVSSVLVGSQVSFTVEATDAGGLTTNGGIAQVLALYRNSRTGAVSTWISAPLPLDSGNVYSGGGAVDASGIIDGKVDFKIWVIDKSGNVSTTDFKNVLWEATTAPPPTSGSDLTLSVGSPTFTPWYDGPVTVTVTGVAGVTYTYSAPGVSGTGTGPTFSFTVPNDGVNLVRVTGGNQSASLTVLIDSTPPGAPIITVPTQDQVFVQDAVVAFDFSCPDVGSGAVSCVGAVAGGESGIASGNAIDTSIPGTHTIAVTATDIFGRSMSSDSVYHVLSVPLVIDGPTDPVALGFPVTASAAITLVPGTTGVWDWGDGVTSEAVVIGEVTGSHTYGATGVYPITLNVDYGNGFVQLATFEYAVVYDPNGGFVTGGGWIDSPAGSYVAEPELTGKANFGFVSKYKKGQSIPTGDTTFKFKAGDLEFNSTSYEWLVIAGRNAKYKGVGIINGSGNFGFMLTACDSAVQGSCQAGPGDTFRIKIWDKDLGDAVVYDNQLGAADSADTGTLLGGGSIVIHAGKK